MTDSTTEIILAPDNIPVLSKTNAATFHQLVKERIFESGNGLFEYLETVKFFAAIDKVIHGDSASKLPADKEFIDYAREQIKLKGDKETLTTPRGVKFANAEVGASYDFTKCADPVLAELEEDARQISEKVKARKEFLKTVDPTGLVITSKVSGETIEIFPPSKTSKSSFKTTLPK
jgi:hypothetical protein